MNKLLLNVQSLVWWHSDLNYISSTVLSIVNGACVPIFLVWPVVYVQVINVLLIILCGVDMVFRIHSVATGVTPWPAHILASVIQIIAMVWNILTFYLR